MTNTKSKIETLEIQSSCLNKKLKALIYLPEGYTKTKSYAVLYFLHGRSGDEQFLLRSNMHLAADRLIHEKRINPLIIVCPNIENSRGINSSPISKECVDSQGRIINIGRYEDYFISELIPVIDAAYATINDSAARFVGGASMGGYAALHYAFRHQNLFSKAGGHMPAIELTLEEEDKQYFPDLSDWSKYNPIKIAECSEIRTDMKVYLDAGDQDEGQFYQGCSILHKILIDKGVECQNHLFDGHHNEAYIKANIEKYLMFYGNII